MFEELMPTRGSAEALAAARGLVSESADAVRLLLLFGLPGVGKTHLVRAIVGHVGERRPVGPIVSRSARDLLGDVTAAIRAERLHDLQRRLGSAGLVAVDDLQVLRPLPRSQKEIGILLNAAVRGGARVVAAAGCPPAHLAPLLAEALSQSGARVVELGPPTPRETRRLLRVIALRRGLSVDAHAMQALANRCGGDLGRGMGALARWEFERSIGRNGPPSAPGSTMLP